jgi:flavin-dependent dehydrogenase
VYDVIVVGARAAGAATAHLLARDGLRVLLVDRGRHGTDTLSIKPAFGVQALYGPRRTVLDRLLVDAAVRAGAEARFGVAVTEVTHDSRGRVDGIVGRARGGREFTARARLVVGADGVRSTVADAVGARFERRGTDALAGYQRTRDALSAELFDVTELIAAHRWTADEIPDLLLGLNAAMNDEVAALAALGGRPTPAGSPAAPACSADGVDSGSARSPGECGRHRGAR